MSDQAQSGGWRTRFRLNGGKTAEDNKFGTLAGVFVPTILTVLGAISTWRMSPIYVSSSAWRPRSIRRVFLFATPGKKARWPDSQAINRSADG